MKFDSLVETILDRVMDAVESGSLKSKLIPLELEFVKAVQAELDEWQQDENGEDAELGFGGICQDLSDAICGVCIDHHIDCTTLCAEMGEQHCWAVAYDENSEEACASDINP